MSKRKQLQNRWTDKKIETLKKMWAQGHTATEISAVLKFVSRSAVLGKLNRLGIRKFPKGHNAHNVREDDVKPRTPVEHRPTSHRFRNNTVVIDAVRNLQDDQCKWPIGDPQTNKFRFCTEKREVGIPYCLHHHKEAWDGRKPEKTVPFQLKRLSLASH